MKSKSAPSHCSVGVVVLSYNDRKLLVECLKSLDAQTVYPQKILVVDNGSRDFSEQKIRSELPQSLTHRVKFLICEKNLGYAKGMNLGISYFLELQNPPDWIMTLNQDTRLDPAFFESFEVQKAAPNVGMLAPKILSMKDPAMIDGVGIELSLDGMSTARGQREKDRRQYDRNVNILIPNGVAALYKTKMLKEIGLFDEDFWSYCEDTDLGLRGWLAGWKCLYRPECRVLHKRSSTLGEHSLKKLYFTERNHFWVALKNYPMPLVLLNPTFTLYRYFIQLYSIAAKKGQGAGFEQHSKIELVTVTLRAIKDALEEAPRMIKKRNLNRSLVKRSPVEILFTILARRLSFKDLILK